MDGIGWANLESITVWLQLPSYVVFPYKIGNIIGSILDLIVFVISIYT